MSSLVDNDGEPPLSDRHVRANKRWQSKLPGFVAFGIQPRKLFRKPRDTSAAYEKVMFRRTRLRSAAAFKTRSLKSIWMSKSKGSAIIIFKSLNTPLLLVYFNTFPCYLTYLFRMHWWINLLFTIWENHRTAVLVVFAWFDLSFASVAVCSCDTDMCAGIQAQPGLHASAGHVNL